MNRITSRLVAGGVALMTAVGLAVVAAPSAGSAGSVTTCVRTVSIEPEVSIAESGGTLTLRVFSSGCAVAGTVSYQVAPRTAAIPSDFVLLSGTVKLPAGNLSPRPITATIVADNVPEGDIEDFTVWLHAPSANIDVEDPLGVGRILDDDQGPELVWVADGEICAYEWIPENIDCEPKGFTSFAPGQPLTLHWSTVDGTAHAGVDFIGVVDQVVTVPTGALSVTLPLELLQPSPGMPRRSFYIRIFNPSTGSILDPVAVVTLEAS